MYLPIDEIRRARVDVAADWEDVASFDSQSEDAWNLEQQLSRYQDYDERRSVQRDLEMLRFSCLQTIVTRIKDFEKGEYEWKTTHTRDDGGSGITTWKCRRCRVKEFTLLENGNEERIKNEVRKLGEGTDIADGACSYPSEHGSRLILFRPGAKAVRGGYAYLYLVKKVQLYPKSDNPPVGCRPPPIPLILRPSVTLTLDIIHLKVHPPEEFVTAQNLQDKIRALFMNKPPQVREQGLNDILERDSHRARFYKAIFDNIKPLPSIPGPMRERSRPPGGLGRLLNLVEKYRKQFCLSHSVVVHEMIMKWGDNREECTGRECTVCMGEKSMNEFLLMSCGHDFCEECVSRHVGIHGGRTMCMICREESVYSLHFTDYYRYHSSKTQQIAAEVMKRDESTREKTLVICEMPDDFNSMRKLLPGYPIVELKDVTDRKPITTKDESLCGREYVVLILTGPPSSATWSRLLHPILLSQPDNIASAQISIYVINSECVLYSDVVPEFNRVAKFILQRYYDIFTVSRGTQAIHTPRVRQSEAVDVEFCPAMSWVLWKDDKPYLVIPGTWNAEMIRACLARRGYAAVVYVNGKMMSGTAPLGCSVC